MKIKRTLIRLIFSLALLPVFAVGASAQCEFQGQVINGNGTNGCGLVILRLDNLEFLVPVGDDMGIEEGQDISFSYTGSQEPGTCQIGTPIELTCMTVLNVPAGNCNADFTFTIQTGPEIGIAFEPVTFDTASTYYWNFGNNAFGFEASGFQNYSPGTYEVCLTVSNPDCEDLTTCQTLDLNFEDECGYMIGYDFVNATTVVASIFNAAPSNQSALEAITWLDPVSGEPLGSSPSLTYSLSSGNATTLCVSYTASLPNNETCENVICQPFNLAPYGCIDWNYINATIPCPAYTLPVCGCDGVTYNNECEAAYYGGVTSWTPGPCPGSPGICMASFHKVTSGMEVALYNTSLGDYTDWEWDMGDGTVISGEHTLSYTYAGENIYEVCLTVWNANGCSAQYCDYLFTGPAEDLCFYTDCVYPGDTDASGAANIYDLLSIGVGYGTQGEPRSLSDADISWTPQYSPDWQITTVGGIDFKHIDCNGDGVISDFDAAAITANYLPAESVLTVQAPGAPLFWLDFELDTIVVDDNSPEFIEIEANLMAGTPQTAVSDLRGFALQLDYEQEAVKENGILIDYFDNSFLGEPNDVLRLYKDRYEDDGELDLAFSRKLSNANGHGKIADITFIVISDIIARSDESEAFVVNVEDVIAVNHNGELLTVGIANADASVVIVNKKITGTNDTDLEKQIALFPNPAKHELNVSLDRVNGEKATLLDALGREILSQQISSGTLQFDVSGLESGVYWLKIYTEGGIAIKKFVIGQ